MTKNNGNKTLLAEKTVTEPTEPPKNEAEAAKNTEVAKWLQANQADIFIEKFYEQGYYKVDSVDAGAIDSIVNPKQPSLAKAKPGLANALKNSLAEQKKRKKEAGKVRPAMVPPKLEPSTVLDLSAPKLPSADGITFSVPKSLSVESTNAAIVSPNNIKPEEWMVIARSANLLYAYDMDGDEPQWAKTPVLDWKVPERDDFARSEILHGEVTSVLTYTDETASYVVSGFDTQTATAGFAFCAGSFERSHKYKTATNSESKTLIQVGMWKYPRVKIYLDKCTVTSERFTKAVSEALAKDHKFYELNKVFKEYGHVVPSAVLLGGQLCYKDSKVSNSSANEGSAQEDIKGKVEGKLGKATASAGFGIGSASENKAGSINLEDFTSFTNLGGDSLLCSNPSAWAPTVKDPKYWAVIEMEDMRPTIDLLEPELRQQVIAVWNSSQAILEPKELDLPTEVIHSKEETGRLYPDNIKITPELIRQNGGFAAAVRHSDGAHAGMVKLISSGFNKDPQEGDLETAAGAAWIDEWKEGDKWIEWNSVCIPVPQEGKFLAKFQAAWDKPDARLVFIPSNLYFGQWECLSDTTGSWKEPKQKDQDGFLFVSIEKGQDGDCGGVKGLFKEKVIEKVIEDGTEKAIEKEIEKDIAGSYVHWDTKSFDGNPGKAATIPALSFCIPVPAGTQFSLVFEPYPDRVNQLKVFAHWLPLVDERWKMEKAVPVTLNTPISAETDGILHGWIRQKNNGDRGMLKFYTGDDAVNVNPARKPCAAASMHYYKEHWRWYLYSSAMIPVAKGTFYKAVYTPTCGKPEAQVFWTPILPRGK